MSYEHRGRTSSWGSADLEHLVGPLGNRLEDATEQEEGVAGDLAAAAAVAESPFTATRPKWGRNCSAASSGRCFAVLTSGGDAQGMNAAVRAAVATGLSFGHTVYAVKNGWRGLVEGGDSIQRMTWEDVDEILSQGGTMIGTARSEDFRKREGRLAAAHNVVINRITNLVVIGGDGSLTGANVFKTEWPDHLKDLLAAGRITEDMAKACSYLNIIGMVGSIDNDMCGFSMTIGADSAMQRIVDACDALITTAASHQRSFVVEVMGRNCGFLALMAGVAVGADWVFMPENPPDCEDWESNFCRSLEKRKQHSNYTLVIVAEGSTDRVRRPITSSYVRELLTSRLGWDSRVTCLGHVQRGGAPSAYDRILGSRLGAEAVMALLQSDIEMPARIIGIRWNQLVQVDLNAAVSQNHKLAAALTARNFPLAMQLRGAGFAEILQVYLRIRRMRPATPTRVLRVAIVFAGAPAAGMNAAAKTAVRELLNFGHVVLGVHGGFVGLARGDVRVMGWSDVHGWTQQGGANLGTNRTLPSDITSGPGGLALVCRTIRTHKIDALMVVGGFEGFAGLLEMAKARDVNPTLCIPMVCVPATISNNVPGTDFSLGSDTATNAIVEAIDRLKLSAASSRGRLFLVESMGGYSGFLATMGALAGGADAVYTHEEGVHMDTILKDVEYLRKKFRSFNNAVIVRNEKCNESLSTHVMQCLFEDEGTRSGEHHFSTRNNILGHLQQGNSPSSLDRVRAVRLASAGVKFLLEKCELSITSGKPSFQSDSVCVSGILGSHIAMTPIEGLQEHTDFKHRVPKEQWHLSLVPLIRVLEKNSTDLWGSECPLKPSSTIIGEDELENPLLPGH